MHFSGVRHQSYASTASSSKVIAEKLDFQMGVPGPKFGVLVGPLDDLRLQKSFAGIIFFTNATLLGLGELQVQNFKNHRAIDAP